MGVFGMHVMRVVDRGRSKKYEYRKKRTVTAPPVIDPATLPREIGVDDLRDLDHVAICWLGAWILCDVLCYELDGPQVSLRSRDTAHLFGWVDAEELRGRVAKGESRNVRLYDPFSAISKLSARGRRLLLGRDAAAELDRLVGDVSGGDGGGLVD